MSTLHTVNPATGAVIAQYETFDPGTLDVALDAAVEAQAQWRERDTAERCDRLVTLARLLRARAGAYARLITLEMGKPLAQAEAEVRKCATACDYYAAQGPRLLAPRPAQAAGARSLVCFRPLGLVLAVMPWNFPFWQVLRFGVPTLTAGNGVLLKHASNVSGCALALERLVEDAGYPRNLFRTLLITHQQTEALIADHRVQAVSLTGSVAAGRRVAALAGAQLKKCVLELGGSDPYLVLADADLDLAARVCADARMGNAGQSCIAAKRLIVVDAVRMPFTARVRAELQRYRCGDPLEAGTTLGPLARADLRDALHAQVRRSIELGARCLLGGEVPAAPGAWYPATLLEGVRPGMPAYDEELFGPVAAILPARDDAEALRIANDSVFGLGAAVFTRDVALGEKLAVQAIEAGSVFVNRQFASSAELPFGGVKASGYGREMGEYGILEFVNVKAVSIDG